MPTEPENDPKFKTISLAAEIKKMYGPEWNKPSPAYEFSNGRKFDLRTEDAAIYETSPHFD